MVYCPYGDPDAKPICQVVRSLGLPSVPWPWEKMSADYCARGTFISCPIYSRVERYLAEHHRCPSTPPSRDLHVP